jgi:AcrR family transcriptional regulator
MAAISHQRTGIRKQQIIDASREIIVKLGGEHVTIKNIAKAVGISEAAIYRHFPRKKDILFFLAEDIRENLVGDIKKGLQQHDSALVILDNIIRDHISAIEQRQGISYQVIAEIISLGDRELNTRFYEIVTEYINNMAELFKQGISQGELRQDLDPVVAATQLYGMIEGLVNVWALSNFTFNLVKRYAPLLEMFRAGIVRCRDVSNTQLN